MFFSLHMRAEKPDISVPLIHHAPSTLHHCKYHNYSLTHSHTRSKVAHIHNEKKRRPALKI